MDINLYKYFFKRILDIILAIIVLPLFVLIFIVIGSIIYCEDKGSIFYNAPRLGKKGKTFNMYKFRSMKMNAPDIRNKDGSTFNSGNDLRLTKIGRFIRKTSIDEIPQVINVIKGDMSFIGPRPDLPEHINYYEGNEKRKLEVLPGITGYNQAYFRNLVTWKDRIKNDCYYVDNISLWLDVKIFFKTIESIVLKKGVYIKPKGKDEEGENLHV